MSSTRNKTKLSVSKLYFCGTFKITFYFFVKAVITSIMGP
ncbi:UNVERIFIED_CONTAM: hypothetical protein NCL1_43454 [Trichonephila clavipes]